ncbi:MULTISPECIES: Rid family hydrolase [Bacillus cereus group]|uniref:Rid family hydrolase n=2 Tax=Bacillus cereus group TaxID=86661 RepID=UPI002FDA762A
MYMTVVCLIRHGETEWNAIGKLQGRENIDLNKYGKQQAEKCGLYLRENRWDVIISSPLSRAKQTAEIVSNAKQTIYISGQVAINADGQIVGVDDLATQTRQVFENIKSALETSGLQFNNVVKLTFFLTDISQMAIVRDIRDQYIDTKNPPASSAVEVRKLINDNLLIEIEAIAVAN